MSHLTAVTGSNIGPLKGLSRMRGNSHVRFLGEPRSVMALAYPTTWIILPKTPIVDYTLNRKSVLVLIARRSNLFAP